MQFNTIPNFCPVWPAIKLDRVPKGKLNKTINGFTFETW